jgi:hypothetical protein
LLRKREGRSSKNIRSDLNPTMDNSSSGELIDVAMSTHNHVKEAAEELIKRGLRAEGTKYREFDVYGSRFMGLLAISQNPKGPKKLSRLCLENFMNLHLYFGKYRAMTSFPK